MGLGSGSLWEISEVGLFLRAGIEGFLRKWFGWFRWSVVVPSWQVVHSFHCSAKMDSGQRNRIVRAPFSACLFLSFLLFLRHLASYTEPLLGRFTAYALRSLKMYENKASNCLLSLKHSNS